jgi:hypothetical protein
MALTDEQRVELERLGPHIVAMRLNAHPVAGETSLVKGFKDLLRKDAEVWLATKGKEEAQQRAKTLWWAVIGGLAGSVGVALVIVQWLFGK